MLILDLVPAWGEWMGGFLIMLQGSIIALWLIAEAGQRGAIAAGLIALLSFLVEYIGVTTGIPFGQYEYTGALGLALARVPLPIPFAWLMVVPGAFMTAAALRRPALIVPGAALLALWLDLLIEPVATYITGYWHWLHHGAYYGIPTSNFVAWGGTALALAIVLRRVAPELAATARVAWLPRLLFGLAVLQFALVDAAYGYLLAALIGCGLLLAVVVLWKRAARR
jgi:putative membrane protein